MTGLDIFTFVVMLVLLGTVGVAVALLGGLPGQIARSRNHPQADAVKVCGWLGVITLGLAWPVALVWAYMQPGAAVNSPAQATGAREGDDGETVARLKDRVEALEQQVQRLGQSPGSAAS